MISETSTPRLDEVAGGTQDVPRAVGWYLAQPSSVWTRRIRRAVTRLSLADHAASFQTFTPGWRLDPSDMAHRLRSIARDLDSIADDFDAVGLEALEALERAA